MFPSTGGATNKILWCASSLGEDTGEDDGGYNYTSNENLKNNKSLGGSAEHRSEKEGCRMGKGGSIETQPGEDGWKEGCYYDDSNIGFWKSESGM